MCHCMDWGCDNIFVKLLFSQMILQVHNTYFSPFVIIEWLLSSAHVVS